MSSRQYQVLVKLKDDGTLKKIENLNSGGGRRGGTGGGMSGGPLGAIAGLNAKMLVKLAGIGVSIGVVAMLAKKSSGQLQGVSNILQTSAMLFLRPMADMLAFALRPLALAFLGFALPFYKAAGPEFIKLGKQIGDILPSLIGVGVGKTVQQTGEELGLGPDAATKQRAQEAYQAWVDFFTKPMDLEPITKVFTDLGTNLWNELLKVPPAISKLFTDFGTNIWNWLIGIPSFIGSLFTNFGELLYNGIIGIPGMILDIFTGLATNIKSTLSGIPQMIYDAIMAMWNSAQRAFGFDNRGGTVSPSSPGRGGTGITATTAAGIADSL